MNGGRLDDDEWAAVATLVIETGPKRGRPPRDHRLVLDGIFWVARTEAPWRELPEEFGNWSSVYRQFLRWNRAGLWARLLDGATLGDARERRRPGAELMQALAAVRALSARPRGRLIRSAS